MERTLPPSPREPAVPDQHGQDHFPEPELTEGLHRLRRGHSRGTLGLGENKGHEVVLSLPVSTPACSGWSQGHAHASWLRRCADCVQDGFKTIPGFYLLWRCICFSSVRAAVRTSRRGARLGLPRLACCRGPRGRRSDFPPEASPPRWLWEERRPVAESAPSVHSGPCPRGPASRRLRVLPSPLPFVSFPAEETGGAGRCPVPTKETGVRHTESCSRDRGHTVGGPGRAATDPDWREDALGTCGRAID